MTTFATHLPRSIRPSATPTLLGRMSTTAKAVTLGLCAAAAVTFGFSVEDLTAPRHTTVAAELHSAEQTSVARRSLR